MHLILSFDEELVLLYTVKVRCFSYVSMNLNTHFILCYIKWEIKCNCSSLRSTVSILFSLGNRKICCQESSQLRDRRYVVANSPPLEGQPTPQWAPSAQGVIITTGPPFSSFRFRLFVFSLSSFRLVAFVFSSFRFRLFVISLWRLRYVAAK